jgi:hypothetical protein
MHVMNKLLLTLQEVINDVAVLDGLKLSHNNCVRYKFCVYSKLKNLWIDWTEESKTTPYVMDYSKDSLYVDCSNFIVTTLIIYFLYSTCDLKSLQLIFLLTSSRL